MVAYRLLVIFDRCPHIVIGKWPGLTFISLTLEGEEEWYE